MLPQLRYGKENASRVSGMTAGLSQVAAQLTINNTITLRQRMNVSVHAVVNNIGHRRGVAFVNEDKGAKGSVSSPHAAVAALTEGLTKIVMRRLRGKVISVGGTAYDHLNNGWHVCQLDNDGRNAPRFNTYLNQARAATANPRAAALVADILSRGKSSGDSMCFDGAYACKRSANVLFFNNSHYDLSFKELSEVMIAHGAPHCVMIGIHPREMLLDEMHEHEVQEFGIVWRKDRKGIDIDADGNVCVGFRDGSNAYVHKLKEYRKWIETTCWSSGHINLILECDFWGPLAIIDVTMTNRPANIARHISLDKPVVMFPDFKYFARENLGSNYRPTTKYHLLDAQIFASLESYAMSKTDIAWTFPTFAGYTKAQATVMTLVDGEWKHYGTHSQLHQLTSDGAVSAFIWLSAQRAARSQLVGKAFTAIAAELKEEIVIGRRLMRQLAHVLQDLKRNATPRYIEELTRYTSLVEPVLNTVDGCWLAGRVDSLKANIIIAPYEHVELPEETETKVQIDADIAAAAIDEYRARIAPLELANAETEIGIRDENDNEVGLYKVIAGATREAIRSEFKTFNGTIEIIEGGPGTGKTQFEAENILGNDIIFVPTRLAKQELESRLKMLSKMNAVYTNHAGLAYALREAANKHEGSKLWVDEAFMQYPGLALLAAAAMRCNSIVFVGDSKQIRAKDFCGAGVQIQTHHFLSKAEVKQLRNNYRNPAQVVEMLNSKFGYDMIAKSPVVGSMEVANYEHMADILEPPNPRGFDRSWRFITFTQEAKNWFINRGMNANTSHEFQGASDRRTALVVTNDLEKTFLDDLGYFIVGYSRCTEKLLVCKVKTIDGVEFRDIKIGNVDLEALTDLFSPVACVSVLPSARLIDLPLGGSAAHFNHNFSISDITDTFDAYWFAAHPYTHHIRSVFKTRVPNAAEAIRIRPRLINNIEVAIDVASFSDYTYLADQDGGSMLAMIETFVSRNGGGRILMDRSYAVKIAKLIVGRTRRKLFSCPIKPLSIDELSMGFERFVRKTIARGKSEHYINADLLDLDRLQAFMKTQLKSKWEPTRENFQTMYEESQRSVYGAAMEGKAGQGVIGWSKPLCFVFAAWINAIEERYLNELKPWVVYATQMGETEMVGRINGILRQYHKCILVKGDDVAIIFMDENGQMRAISWDAAKFDSTQAAVVMAGQAFVMHMYGMPDMLVSYYYNFMENSQIRSLGRVLEMVLHFCRHSGGMETLWGNTNHSLNMVGLVMELDDAGDWRQAKFSESGMRIMKAALGASLKVHEGPIGDFVGYIIQDFSLRPDIFRLSAKVISRRFALGTTVSATQRAAYEEECPALRNHRQPGMLSLYHNIVEYSFAVRDRLSTIISEDDRVQTIRANAALYMPEVPAAEAHARIGIMLDALSTFGKRQFAPIYFEALRRRIMTKYLLPIENEADQEDQSHLIMDRDTCERVVTDLHMVDRATLPVEQYTYRTDDDWNFGIKHQVTKVVKSVAVRWWTRLINALTARIARSRFAGKLWWLSWLLNKIRRPSEAALEDAEDDIPDIAIDAPNAEAPDHDEHDRENEEIEEEVRLAQGFADRYAAIEARVNQCLTADEKCTKTFADFRGVRKYESAAAYKLLDCITADQERDFVEPENMLTACDIGSAPGGCSQVFCEFSGIRRVIAINAPKNHPGALQMQYTNPKIDLRLVDVNTLAELPEADYYFSDVQNLNSTKIIEYLDWALDNDKLLAIKCNNLDDRLAAWLLNRQIILKPRRSNRYSSEFYLLSYEHDDSLTLAGYLTQWDMSVMDLEARRLPNPYASEDNELAGRSTPILNEAYKQITGKERVIRSALQLADLLKLASINFRITQNRQMVHENTRGAAGRHWEIDLDTNEVEAIEDAEAARRRERPRPDNAGARGGDEAYAEEYDHEVAIADEAENYADAIANGLIVNRLAYVPTYTAIPDNFKVSESEIVLWGPILEELWRSLVSRWSALHPIGFAHAEAALFAWRNDFAIWKDQLIACPLLFGMPNIGFLWRTAFHILHNRLVLAGDLSPAAVCAINAYKAALLVGPNWNLRFYVIGLLCFDYRRGNTLLSAVSMFNNIMCIVRTLQAFHAAYKQGAKKFATVVGLGIIYRQFYTIVRTIMPSWMKFDIIANSQRVRECLKLIPALEQLGIDFETPALNWDAKRLADWSSQTNDTIMAKVAEITREANNTGPKMNVFCPPAIGDFKPISKTNKLECLVNFDGAQPIQPIEFKGPQPIQPIEFKSKQPVYFQEAQHVIVDESAADKILGLLNTVASVVVKDGKAEQSAFRIASNGVPLETSVSGGGVASEVTIIGSKITLPVNIANSQVTVPVEIKAPLPLPTSGSSVATSKVENYVARATATFAQNTFAFITVGSKWDTLYTAQNATGTKETLRQALIRLGLAGSDNKAIKPFYLRFSAAHCGYTSGTPANFTTVRTIMLNWQTSVDLREITVRCDVGIDPYTLVTPSSGGQLQVALWKNQNDLYNRNTVAIYAEVFTRI